MRPTSRLVVLLVGVAACIATCASAFDMDTVETDEEGVHELRSALTAGWTINTRTGKGLVATAMARGYWKTAEELITHSKTVRADVTHAVYKSASSIRKQLKTLEEALNKRRSVSKGIPPAFEWAQSPDSVFLNVKFAHKLDTPATLGCKATNVTIAPQSFTFVAECKSKRKVFELRFDPLKELDGEASSWTMASVGRAVFTLKKAKNATWARLLKAKAKPANMHVWWSMKEKYADENAEFAKVESKIKRQEFEEQQRAKAAAAAAGESADAAVADAAPTPDAAPAEAVDVEDTAPALSQFDLAKADLEKKYRKLKRNVDEDMKSSIATIDKDARAEKKKVLERAAEEKKAIAAAAEAKRKSAADAATTRREELEAQLESELAALRLAHGEQGSEL